MKATTYSYRCYSTGEKIVGGSIPRDTSLDEAVLYATRQLKVKAFGVDRCAFTHNDKPVYVYLTLDPSQTELGKSEMRLYAKRIAEREAEEGRLRERLDKAVDSLVLQAGGVEAAIKALKLAGENLPDEE